MKRARLISLMLVLTMVLVAFASCKNIYQEIDVKDAYVETRTYKSLYDTIGKQVTIDMVEEDKATGLCYVTVDGTKYELGMDFLSMAMVYNAQPAGSFATAKDAYLEWWRLYMQRWNYLVAEVPLYSNQYYDVYSTKIDNLETHPYWGVTDAILYSNMKDSSAESKFILGNSTELSGEFRYPSWAVSSPAASNNDIGNLITGLGTVVTNQEGAYIWNDTVVAEHTETENEDGSKTFTVKIKEGLVFSDDTPVTAKNYVYQVLVFSSPVGTQAMNGTNKRSGMNYVGFADFAAATTSTAFKGIQLLDDYTYALTVDAEYLPYYFDVIYAGLSPQPKALWLPGDADIVIFDDKSVGLNDAFYAGKEETVKDEETGEDKTTFKYDLAQTIADNRFDYTNIPFSGPYKVANWDANTLEVTLTINDKFPGNFEGRKPTIQTLVYVKVISETSVDQLKSGGVDVLAGVTGADETNAALKAVNESNGGFAYSMYNRAGYGKLGFRADFGPAMFTEVRQVIAKIIDQEKVCQTFTGGFGKVVYGAYGLDMWMYTELTAAGTLKLNSYTTSVDTAIETLEKGGWIYNSKGQEYKKGDGIRYKKLAREEQIENNLTYASKDNKYKTVKIEGEYYMPLVINWFGTENNPFTDVLKTEFAGAKSLKDIGMDVQYTIGDFTGLLGEYYQYAGYGYQGPALYSAFNFATSFSAAAYDYSWNWTIDPDMYEDYSAYYIKDAADFVWDTAAAE